MAEQWSQSDYHHPAAGWGAAKSVAKVMAKHGLVKDGTRALIKMNHVGDEKFDCPGCAWPDNPGKLAMDFCENGVKHLCQELDPGRATREFFAHHTVSSLESMTDLELENQGRLTEPMVYEASTDHYVPIRWQDAYAMIAEELQGLDSPNEAAFYTSGRLSNEASFLYQLFAREYGTNNLPDCSNMCHEGSGRALRAAIGTGKGTCDLEDWESADAIFVMGVNAAANAPRMLTALTDAHRGGAKIVHVNPLVEVAATRAIVPHEVLDMALNMSTPTSDLNLQVRPGGDMALLRGIAKCVFEAAEEDPSVIDSAFVEEFTDGYEAYKAVVDGTSWEEIVTQAGLTEAEIRAAGDIYLAADSAIIAWCLGVTQHEHGVDSIREIVNVLLLRGNIGRKGAGPSPVRGHSNVQGNRTCGIDHNPAESFYQTLEKMYGLTLSRQPGLDTVRTVKGMMDGSVKVFVGLGGNFVLAAPDTPYTMEGLRKCSLTVQVSTKLNRSHLVHGVKALILPCLGRTEKDRTGGITQGVTVEDAMSMVHISHGFMPPASPDLRSEVNIIARIAATTLPKSNTRWIWYAEDYDRIRDAMEQALPGFTDFNRRCREKHGFRIAQPAREREFITPTGKANFNTPPLPDVVPTGDTLILQTMRSHDQWNTTVYSDNDRYRGIKNLRTLVLMNAEDMADRGIIQGELVNLEATSRDGSTRNLNGYTALTYSTPRGSAAGYMPEMNVLLGHDDYSTQSDQPLMKQVRVTITAA
ncbi:MAG: FdhF/YdeP family oxidoreductase [Cellulomonadaceae bacterium]|jgi:molybdopterin-dependent oxidoreductase alpha subunit|nr:FdhF/YdeP family oxidoreductase [Cellulomonadaceae bacterium]